VRRIVSKVRSRAGKSGSPFVGCAQPTAGPNYGGFNTAVRDLPLASGVKTGAKAISLTHDLYGRKQVEEPQVQEIPSTEKTGIADRFAGSAAFKCQFGRLLADIQDHWRSRASHRLAACLVFRKTAAVMNDMDIYL
jgi:hypothetical protein